MLSKEPNVLARTLDRPPLTGPCEWALEWLLIIADARSRLPTPQVYGSSTPIAPVTEANEIKPELEAIGQSIKALNERMGAFQSELRELRGGNLPPQKTIYIASRLSSASSKRL